MREKKGVITTPVERCEYSYKKRNVFVCRISGIDCNLTKHLHQCKFDSKVCNNCYFIGIDAYCKITRSTCDNTKKRGKCTQ